MEKTTTKCEIATLKKVQELFNWEISPATASHKIQLVRDALDKQKPRVISISELNLNSISKCDSL